ncbi:beta-lactamase family protein [Flagellimonas sp. 389]|uniref:serine hydrolase domain-containing protein n=1 Tax=Flagellimonas sp. 389 TaxID=2835862 RepID=UPI001BD6A593|nr:serine hydrolase domain-containing protein [Flagellimonas sp. 389]MBS9462865.1 beta-lactamase family protein [Flagellimonas sp. 389]
MKTNTKQFIIAVSLTLIASCADQKKTSNISEEVKTNTESINMHTPYGEFLDQIDTQIPQWLDLMGVPGAAFALIENGAIVFKKGYGYADLKNQISITAETGFNIGSISKTLTAWGVLKLVEQGKIRLDDPIENYLTRWHLPESEFSKDSVTIRRVLGHTAGLSVHGFPGYTEKDHLPTIEQVLLGKSNTNQSVRIIQQPGMGFRYSGGGITALQLIIEEVTNLPFEVYMEKEIFNPLGMNSTSFTISDSILSNSSLAHNESGEVIPLVLFTAKAAAGAHSNLNDLSRFALASLDGKHARKPFNRNKYQSVIKPETVDLMTSLVPNSNETGLGYQVDLIKDGVMMLVGHEGNNYGWNAYFKVDRISGDGFVMLTNGGSHRNVYRHLECEWLGWKLSKNYTYNCESVLLEKLREIYKDNGVKAMLNAYTFQKENNQKNYHFTYGIENFFNQIGNNLKEQNQLLDAIEVFKFNYGEHPNSFDAFYSLGEALIEAKDIQGYIEISDQKRAQLNKRNDLSSEERAGELIYIGIQLKDIEAYEKAEDVLKETLSIRQNTAPKSWTTFNTKSLLGEVQMHLKEYKNAYTSTTTAYIQLKENVQSIPNSARKLRMQQALNRVMELLQKTENNSQLLKWRTEQSFIDSL